MGRHFLRRRLRLLRRDERGATLIFVAVGLPVFVLFAVFVLDVGNWWVHKRHLQIQADAAALAGASKFRYPNCDDNAIAAEAIKYSGAAKWDTSPASYGAATPEYNAQLGNSDPAELFAGVNRPYPYGRTTILDADLTDSPPPCSTGFVDVKVTETDLPWFFKGFGLTEFIDAEARVALKQGESFTDLIPVGVEEVNPKRVHVWFYNEATGAEIGSAELQPNGDEDGLMIYDNNSAPANFSLHGERVGVKVALSGSDSVTCGEALVLCYGSSTEGLTRIRGYDTSGTGVRLGAVNLTKETCAADEFGAHDNGYFSTTCSADTIQLSLSSCLSSVCIPFSGGDPLLQRTVKARIEWRNNNKVVDLTWNATEEVWEASGLPIEAIGAGSRRIAIEWKQLAGTLNGQTCANGSGNPCQGDFLDAHKVFSGARANAGPIKQLQVDVDVFPGVNNVPRCAVSEACPHNFVVRLALTGRLELAETTDPPISLRVFGGSVNQSLDCNPDETQLDFEISNGCQRPYGKNSGQACPNNVPDLWASPPPWRCVALAPGANVNAPASGLNDRILCKPPNSAGNCTQFGRPTSCTNWPKFPDWESRIDPRELPVFVVPFGAFDTSGSGTVPVIDFAFFYVTGWTSNGAGWQNPCKNDPVHPDVFVPGTENDSGSISGHWVRPAVPSGGGTAGNGDCDLTQIFACVAVMTK
jgi:hypothetical protein